MRVVFKTMYLISLEKYDALNKRFSNVKPDMSVDNVQNENRNSSSNCDIRSSSNVQTPSGGGNCDKNNCVTTEDQVEIKTTGNTTYEKHVKLFDCPTLTKQKSELPETAPQFCEAGHRSPSSCKLHKVKKSTV